MSMELTIICGLWCLNTVLALIPSFYREISIIAQKTLIMCVSSLWPLIQSYKEESFDESLTYEVLQNMELILLNPTALNAFEGFLKHLDCEDRVFGENLLLLWYRISTYTSTLREELTLDINDLEAKCFGNSE